MKDVKPLKEVNTELENIFEYPFAGILVTDVEGKVLKLKQCKRILHEAVRKEAFTKNVRELDEMGVFFTFGKE